MILPSPVLDVSCYRLRQVFYLKTLLYLILLQLKAILLLSIWCRAIGFLVSAMPEDESEEEVQLNLKSLCC